MRISSIRTPWAVVCHESYYGVTPCGQVFLTRQEYDRQMNLPDAKWHCPRCGGNAYWDDDNYESFYV